MTTAPTATCPSYGSPPASQKISAASNACSSLVAAVTICCEACAACASCCACAAAAASSSAFFCASSAFLASSAACSAALCSSSICASVFAGADSLIRTISPLCPAGFSTTGHTWSALLTASVPNASESLFTYPFTSSAETFVHTTPFSSTFTIVLWYNFPTTSLPSSPASSTSISPSTFDTAFWFHSCVDTATAATSGIRSSADASADEIVCVFSILSVCRVSVDATDILPSIPATDITQMADRATASIFLFSFLILFLLILQ